MTKQISEHAACAKAIRQYLKAEGIKGRVRSECFAGGTSVNIRLDASTSEEQLEQVSAHVSQYKYGAFDGMIDLYEYDNRRDDIPQVKYVFCCIDWRTAA